MMRYAKATAVPIEQSKAEIEGVLRRYGADGFRSGWRNGTDGRRVEQIDFSYDGRTIRFTLVMPPLSSDEFALTPHRNPRMRKKRSEGSRLKAWEQACRQRWRALNLCVKAKLEAVECNISTFESEFLAFIVDPNTGKTVGETLRPQIAAAYESGGRIGLPGLPSPEEFDEALQ